MKNKKIAIVCDWLKDFGGAEIVLEHLLEIFPDADIFTSVFFMQGHKMFEGRKVTTSFLQKIPFLNRSHKLALTLRPMAFESFDLSEYDIVISSSSAESKGIITKPDTLHFCYCHTPTRYFWSHYHEYLSMGEFGIFNPIIQYLMPKIIHSLRIWDFVASKRVDYFIANSSITAKRISKYYGEESLVIHPGVDISKIPFESEKKDYYFYNGRCVPYKKFDLIVDAFNENGKEIIIVSSVENKLTQKLQKISKPNITWKFHLSNSETDKLLSKARGFLFPPEEDFGLAPIFALATGTPVIAYGKGGSRDYVEDGKNGIFFHSQTVESLNDAIEKFEGMNFDAEYIHKTALKFDKGEFQRKMMEFIEEKI